MQFISSVRFDPGMEYDEFLRWKKLLVEKYGFRKTQISQSSYFRKNKFVIKIG